VRRAREREREKEKERERERESESEREKWRGRERKIERACVRADQQLSHIRLNTNASCVCV